MSMFIQHVERAWAHSLVRSLILASLGAMVMGALAQIPPFKVHANLVPITLQTLGILLLAATLGPRLAAAALAEYVLLGAAGVPWFAGFTGGPAVLAGPTLGYLLAFPVAAAIAGLLYARLVRGSYAWKWLGAWCAGMTGALVILLGGTAWLCLLFHGDIRAALLAGFVPFLLVDALKAAVVASVTAMRK